ncbi:glycosyltransferase [Treponema sp.]|uniref:glycosyltransferase n=1 Tax=Treponema sp. TaxID=166 RepID=UPI00298EACD8|nr:glycosyltransferase [Treponema sp.]MCR5614467.1 hypothetical protein [Treponema sp.]
MKKKKCIVTGGTKKDVGNIATLIVNIRKLNIQIDEVVVFHDGISLYEQKRINRIFPTKFYYYQFKNYDPANFSVEINKYFSPMVLCKYECLRLLSEYSCVIWSDYDVVLKTDFQNLLENSSCNAQFLPVKQTSVLKQFYKEIKNEAPQFDYSRSSNCYSVFAFYDNFDYLSAYDYCISAARKYGKFLRYGEQGIFEFMLQEYNLNIQYLAKEYSVHPTSKSVSKALIIHAYCQPKFWNGLHNDEWEENYDEWLHVYFGKLYRYRFVLKKIKSIFTKCILYMKKIIKMFLPYGIVKLFIIINKTKNEE